MELDAYATLMRTAKRPYLAVIFMISKGIRKIEKDNPIFLNL